MRYPSLTARRMPAVVRTKQEPRAPVHVRSAVMAAAALLCPAYLPAQTAEPTVVEVQPGDTFSAIAARYTGSIRSWSKLYDARLSQLADPNRIFPGQHLELVTEAAGRRYLRLVGGNAARIAAGVPAAGEPPASKPGPARVPTPAPVATAAQPNAAAATPVSAEMVVGVLPFIPSTALMAQYESLKSYLERQTGQKVRVVLPASFKAFFDSTVRGEFDLAVSAPHLARVAQLEARLVPLAIYEPRIAAQLVAPIDGAVSGAADLRGKAVAFANPQSLVAMYGQQWLHQQSLDAGKDYEVKGARTDLGVGRMMLSGDAVAAIMSNGEFRALPQEEAVRIKIVEVFARIPNFILLGNPKLGKDGLARLKTQLLSFMADKEDGVTFGKATGVGGIVEVDEATLRELDAFVPQTRRAMGLGN
jgi:phosphonate transport system substrate-binding protein